MKKIIAFLSLTMLASSLHAAEPVQVNVQQDGNIFYNATKYPNGVNGIATAPLQMAMDANGVMFDQDESTGTRARLFWKIKNEKGLSYALWAAKKGLSVKSEKKRLQKKGDDRGYCSDAIFIILAEEANDVDLLTALRESTLEVVTPNLEVAQMLKTLNDAGHHVAVLSNMGNSLLDLQAKALKNKIDAKTMREDEQKASEFLYTVISDNDHNVVSSSLSGRPHKPADAIYQQFLKKNRRGEVAQADQVTVLVDDKLENIEAAVQNGFVGIFCKKYKAADAMRDALPKLTGKPLFE